MGSFSRFGRYIREVWNVIVKGEDDDLKRQIRSVEEQVARLREQRIRQQKEREAFALHEARMAVEKIRELHDSLEAADAASSEFAEKLGKQARAFLKTQRQIEEKAHAKYFEKEKEMFQASVRNMMEESSGVPPHLLSQLESGDPVMPIASDAAPNEVDIEKLAEASTLKADGEFSGSSDGGPMQSDETLRESSSSQQAVLSERMQEKQENSEDLSVEAIPDEQGVAVPKKKMKPAKTRSAKKVSLDQLSPSDDVKKVDIEAVSNEILAQIIEEDMKKTVLEEKVRKEQLDREREVHEREIEAEARAEVERMMKVSQGSK